MNRVIAMVAATLAAIVTSAGASSTAAGMGGNSGPATGSLTMRFPPAQLTGRPDPSGVSVEVEIAGTDCRVKCELWSEWSRRGTVSTGLVATWTGPTSATKRVRDTLGVDEFMSHYYYVYRYRANGTYERLYWSWASAASEPDAVATLGPGFRRDLDLQATETMVLRSTVPGARVTFPALDDSDRLIGIVSERGPKAGVLRVAVGGSPVLTVDLKSATASKRAVVGSVRVPAGSQIRLENATPAGRSQKLVSVDGLVDVATNSSARESKAPREKSGRADGEGIAFTVPKTQIPAGSEGIEIDLAVNVKGCPRGCSVLRQITESDDPEVIWSKTSPASDTVQTIHIPTVAPFTQWELLGYTLVKGGEVAGWVDVTPRKLEQDYASTNPYYRSDKLVYSHGWSQDSMASATGGAIARSSTPNTGMTYRVDGEFEGRQVALVAARGPRNGVMKIYNDLKLIETIDLYAAKWQPRQVISSFYVDIDKRLTVVNATPASRPNKDIHVDALVIFGGYDDWYRAGR